MTSTQNEMTRDLGSLLSGLEKRCLVWLARRMPVQVNSDHLTALGLFAMLGADGVLTSPFWFTLEGALVGLLIGYLATRFGGEGKETVGR